ncbi:hypothetical protein Bca52824_002656 [Brassica carinata]|uniref:RING-type domain-containing protein n=1 Tax=Brassica carinata TaxID=52824 RepID=A0A8X7WL42_BRACI|nr:hypothetical protein Bca52824_002656 [Brassica carinata]
MIRPNVDYHIKQCDLHPHSSDNSVIITVDTLSDDDIQLFPSVLIHISLRNLGLPYIRDLIQGQLIRRRWLGPEISMTATQLGFSSTELLRDPLVGHHWFFVHRQNRYSTPIEIQVLSRMVQRGKMNKDDLTSPKMETESCLICLDNFVFDDGSSSKHGVPTRMTCSHVFHDGCLLEWFQRKDTCPLCRTLL